MKEAPASKMVGNLCSVMKIQFFCCLQLASFTMQQLSSMFAKIDSMQFNFL